MSSLFFILFVLFFSKETKMPNKRSELHLHSNNTLPFQVKVNFFKVNKIPSKWTTFEVKTLLSKMTQILSKKNSLSLKKCFLFLLFGFSSFFLKPFLFLVKIFAIKSNKTVIYEMKWKVFFLSFDDDEKIVIEMKVSFWIFCFLFLLNGKNVIERRFLF